MESVALATEDLLSEAVCLKLLRELPSPIVPSPILRRDGAGYLRSKMASWRQISQRQPIFLLTDLDRMTCPLDLLNDWFGAQPINTNFVFRIAVREVESWLLSDHDAMRKLLGPKSVLHPAPDQLISPKEFLLNSAKKASRAVREDLVKSVGSVARQGIGYNSRLVEFVNNDWNAARASERSPSLQRARYRLDQLAYRLSN